MALPAWLAGLVPGITELVGKFITDKDQAARLTHELVITLENNSHEIQMGQIDVNKTQAQHASIFVAGARPAIMWVCGFSLAWNYVLYPIVLWAVWMFPEYQAIIETAPRLDDAQMITVLLGLLGLGGMRTFEKKNGVARNSMKDDPKNG